jgi:hypothetical protein
MTSAVAFASALYSDSVLDLETVCYFHELHDKRFAPRKMAKPIVDLLSFGQHAQSSPEKTLSFNDDVW